MRTIYEVMVNGSPVYNGEDVGKARAARDEWTKSGRVVEYTAVTVPDVIDATPTAPRARRIKAVRS